MMYNLSFIENQTSFAGAVQGVNNITEGWLFGGLMLVLFMIMVINFYGRISISSIMAGIGFIFSILSVLLIKAELLPSWILGVCVAFMMLGIIIMFMEKKE